MARSLNWVVHEFVVLVVFVQCNEQSGLAFFICHFFFKTLGWQLVVNKPAKKLWTPTLEKKFSARVSTTWLLLRAFEPSIANLNGSNLERESVGMRGERVSIQAI